MIEKYGASVSPWSTPATMSKYSVSPSGERTFTLVFLQRIVIAATVSFGRPYASRICSIFLLCMESKALVKSTNSNVACRFFARTPSRILRMVNICEVMDIYIYIYIYIYKGLNKTLNSVSSRPWNIGKEEVLRSPQSSWTTTSPSDAG